MILSDLEKLIATKKFEDENVSPQFFRLGNEVVKDALNKLIVSEPGIRVSDTIHYQLRGLMKALHPSERLKANELERAIDIHLNGMSEFVYGVWVYYPWRKTLVHILDESEFVLLRTNRNKYKITDEEQNELAQKTIGIIGLSVGQAIALTIAMERVCGHLKLADFDSADLSNLNRLRAGVASIGINKAVIAAREILEIDPYLKVSIFKDGVTEKNMDEFFSGGNKLDLLVEVCDGLDMKIQARYKARALHIPVVMDTNDRGMLDVERFDLTPERAILHGLADGLDPKNIKGLSNEEKVPYVLRMVGASTLSVRMKASMLEVEQSITSWPQLASSVALGGGITTDVARRILLHQFHESGRYYVDCDDLICDKGHKIENTGTVTFNPFKPVNRADMLTAVRDCEVVLPAVVFVPDKILLNKIIAAAAVAPSAGNNQPWKWVQSSGRLYLIHDKARSWSWGDYDAMGAYMSLGTAIEHVRIQANDCGLAVCVDFFPVETVAEVVCAITFSALVTPPDHLTGVLARNLFLRCTNRNTGQRVVIPKPFFEDLKKVAEASGNLKMLYIDDASELSALGEIVAACDKIRLLHQQGHEEFYSELRWNEAEATATGDGIDVSTASLTQGEVAGINIAKDWKAVQLLSEWNKGDGFKKLTNKTFKTASAAVLFTLREFNHRSLVEAGRDIDKAWIFANSCGAAVHPSLSCSFFFSRLVHGKGIDCTPGMIDELNLLRTRFRKIFPMPDNFSDIFMMKLSVVDDNVVKSLRKPIDEIFFDLDS